MLQRVGLENKLKNKIFELSGGEQQWISLARLMLKSCDIILADEPTGSLDIKNRDNVLNILKSLNNDGKTIVIVTHNPYISNACSRKITL